MAYRLFVANIRYFGTADIRYFTDIPVQHHDILSQILTQGSIFLDDCRISGYFDTKFIAVVLVEPILHKFEDLKIANILNLEEVYFLVTRVIYRLSDMPSLTVMVRLMRQVSLSHFYSLLSFPLLPLRA